MGRAILVIPSLKLQWTHECPYDDVITSNYCTSNLTLHWFPVTLCWEWCFPLHSSPMTMEDIAKIKKAIYTTDCTWKRAIGNGNRQHYLHWPMRMTARISTWRRREGGAVLRMWIVYKLSLFLRKMLSDYSSVTLERENVALWHIYYYDIMLVSIWKVQSISILVFMKVCIVETDSFILGVTNQKQEHSQPIPHKFAVTVCYLSNVKYLFE